MKVYNLHDMPAKAEKPFPGGCLTQMLGGLAGSQKLYVNIDVIPPGQYSAKFHAHSRQEEFFLILEGEATLRTSGGERPVHEGDFFAKTAGLDHPHTLYNCGNTPLCVLDIGTREDGDVAWYPDDNTFLLRGTGIALQGTPLQDWSSEPNSEE